MMGNKKKQQLSPEMKKAIEEWRQKFDPPDESRKFSVTCRSCDGKGRSMVFGGPDEDPCETCGGLGIQYIDTLEPREWVSARHYETDILGVCKDCGSYLGAGKPCKVMKKELDRNRMTLRTRNRDGSVTHSPNYKMVAKPNSTCNAFTEGKGDK